MAGKALTCGADGEGAAKQMTMTTNTAVDYERVTIADVQVGDVVLDRNGVPVLIATTQPLHHDPLLLKVAIAADNSTNMPIVSSHYLSGDTPVVRSTQSHELPDWLASSQAVRAGQRVVMLTIDDLNRWVPGELDPDSGKPVTALVTEIEPNGTVEVLTDWDQVALVSVGEFTTPDAYERLLAASRVAPPKGWPDAGQRPTPGNRLDARNYRDAEEIYRRLGMSTIDVGGHVMGRYVFEAGDEFQSRAEVMVHRGRVVAYCTTESVAESADRQVIALVVARDYRRHSVGSTLLTHVANDLETAHPDARLRHNGHSNDAHHMWKRLVARGELDLSRHIETDHQGDVDELMSRPAAAGWRGDDAARLIPRWRDALTHDLSDSPESKAGRWTARFDFDQAISDGIDPFASTAL